MFTGIIEDLGRVESVGNRDGVYHTSLRGTKSRSNLLMVRSKILCDQKIGESIAVNGACLTITDLKNDVATFDVMEETSNLTNLTRLEVGDKVNLERALKAGDRLSGHFVTGHIDCVAKVSDTTIISPECSNFSRIASGSRSKTSVSSLIRDERTAVSDTFKITVTISKENMKFIVTKGSIALDGVSLTIGDIGEGSITVYLIPHTIKNTTLGGKKVGDDLNVEFDILGKYALNKIKEAKKSNITEEFLKEKGFC